MKLMIINLFLLFTLAVSCKKSGNTPTPAVTEPTWKKLTSGTISFLNYVYFTNATNGFVFGDGGAGIKTTNGGTNWVSFNTSTTAALQCGTFFDSNIGFAAGNAVVIRTTDGGNTWTTAATPPSGFIFGIGFSSATTGYALNNSGQLFKTTDGGNNWSTVTSPSANARSIYFVNSTLGIITGLNGTVLKTIDGGATWNSIAPPGTSSATITTSTSTDASIFYLTDHVGKVYKSTDAGSTWTVETTGISTALRDIKFVGQFGIAVGDNGIAISTSNGGTTWKNYTPVVTDLLNSVYILNSEKAFAVGWNGALLGFSK